VRCSLAEACRRHSEVRSTETHIGVRLNDRAVMVAGMEGVKPMAERGFRGWLDLVSTVTTTVAAVVVVAWVVARPSVPAPSALALPVEPLGIEPTHAVGNAKAPIVMIEFSDFECPFCGTFTRDTLPRIKADFIDSGEVQLAFRHLPLSQIHPRAERAAAAAACAGFQAQFSAMHDALFSEPLQLEEAAISAHARRLGLDAKGFGACLDGPGPRHVAADVALAGKLGLRGTPVFLVGLRQSDGRVKVTEIIRGAAPPDQFAAALKRARSNARPG
jgi:protein-disulfide isomerase